MGFGESETDALLYRDLRSKRETQVTAAPGGRIKETWEECASSALGRASRWENTKEHMSGYRRN